MSGLDYSFFFLFTFSVWFAFYFPKTGGGFRFHFVCGSFGPVLALNGFQLFVGFVGVWVPECVKLSVSVSSVWMLQLR